MLQNRDLLQLLFDFEKQQIPYLIKIAQSNSQTETKNIWFVIRNHDNKILQIKKKGSKNENISNMISFSAGDISGAIRLEMKNDFFKMKN